MGNTGPKLAAGAAPSPSSPLAPPTCTYANESSAIAALGTSLLIAALRSNNSPSTGTFLSPLSIYSALVLAFNAAEPGTKTHQELLHLLASSSSPTSNEATLNAQLAALNKMLLADSTTQEPGAAADGGEAPCTLLTANGIFSTSPVNTQYSQLMASLFQATTETVAGADEINAWVNKNTRGEIPTLLPPGQPISTVLANALYFKGTWSHKFDKDMTHPAPFQSKAGQRKVSMMKAVFKGQDRVKVESVAALYDAVELPYLGGRFNAFAVLPAEGVSLEDTLKALDVGPGGNNSLKKVLQTPLKTIVSMPKFRAESTLNLKQSLQGLGVQTAFQPGANFDRLSPGLFISDVVHKALVDVDEEGTVAAAATAVMMLTSARGPSPPPFELVFDRPFVFLIRHAPTGTPVFMGVVTAPPEA